MSIKYKILLSFLSVAVLIGLLGGLAFYHNIEQAEHLAQQEAEAIAGTVAVFADNIADHTGPVNSRATRARLQELIMHFKSRHDRDLVIVDTDKVIIADSVPEELGTSFVHDLRGEVDQTLFDGRVRTFAEHSVAYPQGIKQLVVPLNSHTGARLGGVILEYTPLYAQILGKARADARRFFYYYLAALFAALASGYLVHRHITSPLSSIQQAALRVASGDLTTKIPMDRDDEFGSLAGSFNLMTDELRTSQDNLLRSHQQLEREIAVRRQAEEELRKALERLGAEKSKADAVIHGLGVGIIMQDLDYRVLYENETQQRMVGNHIGEVCYQAYERKDELCGDCPMVFSVQDGAIHRTERRMPAPEGDRFYELTTSPLRDATGAIIGGIKMVREITERRRDELELQKYRTRLEELVSQRTQELSVLSDQLRQAQKMEAVGQLAGGIAHDFNNILSAIINCATILQMELRDDDPLLAYADQILASSDRAAHLTRSLLAFSRKQIIKPRPINLNEVIKNVERLLYRIIGENIELRTRLTHQTLTVMADTGQLEQVLVNLVTNARDAMPGGGQVVISSELMELDEPFIRAHGFGKPGPYARVSITDTGTGIDEQIQPKIFEPFFTTKEIGKGTGLGLSIVYGIIKQHHGYITVASEPGHGAAFSVFLPQIEPVAAEDAWSKTQDSLPRGTETILLAEDDEGLRESARRLLERFGYRVLEAKDGEEAIRLFRDHQDTICLAVLDMIMPKMNGREVHEAIRKSRPGMKTLLVSGYVSDLMLRKDDEEFEVIQKPLQPADFLKKVRAALDGFENKY